MDDMISRRTLLGAGLAAAGAVLLGEDATAGGQTPPARPSMRKVVVWSEGTAPKSIYPNDVNTVIAEGLKPLKNWEVVTASIDQPDQGINDELLNSANVLIWWGHKRHDDVKQELVTKIVKRVKEDGMGFIATHSAHYSKPLKQILGTNCGWKYYVNDGSKLTVVVKDPMHPIARGVKDFDCPHTERYGDPFEVPKPEAFVFDGIYTLPNGTSEHSQQGLTWTIGTGRVFYFQPGHEEYPMYFQPEIQAVFRNAVRWVGPRRTTAVV
jgi:trehalose utilization protein